MTEAQWIKTAVECINRGCDLMTDEQVGKWEGVRGVLESVPLPEFECKVCGRKFDAPALLTGCCVYRGNLKQNSNNIMKEYQIQPTGEGLIDFIGERLARNDSRDQDATRWHSLTVYAIYNEEHESEASGYIAVIHYGTQWQDERDTTRYYLANTLAELADRLMAHNPLQDATAVPVGESYSEQRISVLDDLLGRWKAMLGETLAEAGVSRKASDLLRDDFLDAAKEFFGRFDPAPRAAPPAPGSPRSPGRLRPDPDFEHAAKQLRKLLDKLDQQCTLDGEAWEVDKLVAYFDAREAFLNGGDGEDLYKAEQKILRAIRRLGNCSDEGEK